MRSVMWSVTRNTMSSVMRKEDVSVMLIYKKASTRRAKTKEYWNYFYNMHYEYKLNL